MKRSLLCLFAVLAATCLSALSPALELQVPAVQSPSLTHEAMEDFLKDARILRHRYISVGITNSKRATLSDGRLTHDAHIQTIDEYKPRFESMRGTELNFRDTYKFNIAGHILDQILELNMVPCSVERKFQGSSAAFTWWIDDVLMTELDRVNKKRQPPDSDSWNRQMYIVRVFDQLIFNTDRNLGNLVITKDWKIWMIDHTRAFRLHRELDNPKNLTRCDRRLFAKLRELDEETLKKRLGEWLRDNEIEALAARSKVIVKHFEDLAAEKGDVAVFYDVEPRPALGN